MPDSTQQVQARRVRRVAITIPAAGSPANLETLVMNALKALDPTLKREQPWIIGGLVNEATADYTAGDSEAHPDTLLIPADTVYYEPACGFLANTWVQASAGAPITGVVVSVYLTGDGSPV